MKNLVRCDRQEYIHAHISKLLRTDVFRRSYLERGFVFEAIDRFSKLPRVFCEMSDPDVEWSHFSAWWGVIPQRQYDNDAVSDLYYLHEMTHASRMAYIPNMSFEGWKNKLFENELEASVVSEIQVYLELPDLRPKSFPHEIYADRFLSDDGFISLWKAEPQSAMSLVRECRRDLYYAGPEIEQDLCARWVKRFARQNSSWVDIWYRRYNDVETGMHQLQKDSHNPQIGRSRAMDHFVAWLTSEDMTPTGGTVPFLDEANAFAAIYKLMKANYFKDMTLLEKQGVEHHVYHPAKLGL